MSSSVRKKPGLTTVVWIPNGSISGASDSIQPSTPNFDAAYALVYSAPARPASDEIVTTCPERCVRMTGRTARVTFMGPMRLTVSWRSICSGVSSSKKPASKLAALLTSTSMPPKRSTAASTAAPASCWLVTSSLTTSRSSESPSASATASGLRPVATTLWPAASAALAKSTPMPRPAPVMNQVFLSVLMALSKAPIWKRWESLLRELLAGTPRAESRVYAWGVEAKQEIREFLTSRRGRITPEQAGLPTYGSSRVPGLRHEEVAVLAGVSIQYYTRLERGGMNGVSEGVLEALARALQLDDAERAHLLDLARAAHPTPARPRRRHAKPRVRPEVQWILDAITGAAAFVGNERLDILASNQLGRALFSELYAAPGRPVNSARFLFLDPRAEAAYGDWDRVANETVAILRSAAGRDPYDRDLSDLVGELATQSAAFSTRWASHNVRFHNTGVKHLNHPVVGELHLSYNRLDLAADPGLTIFTYTAEPGSRSEEGLKLLGSWAATVDPAESARATGPS